MIKKISDYASLVKFPHTVFALPFALVSYVYALVANPEIQFDWLLLVKILLCMVLARNAAMGFNRWADRKIDAENPRTAEREIPSGRISSRAAFFFVLVNAAGFVLTAYFINRLAFLLSPFALFVIIGYSFTKRFTVWSHIVLGTALAIAPVGAYIAVTGSIAVVPLLLAGIVVTWTGGFDILYSMQDADYDRKHNLYSVPAKYSMVKSSRISLALHIISAYGVIVMGIYREFNGGIFYWIGAGLFISLLTVQHAIFRPSRISYIVRYFGLLNGLSSIIFAAFAIVDLLLI